MNVTPTEFEPDEVPKAAPRYTYPSGSRPLEGYTIKRGVGRGGFGEVYFALSDAGKEVALKLIRRNLDVEIRGVTHCLNLKHGNLIALYDIRTDEHDDRWVVMEYISGQSLEDVIEAHPGGMPVELAMQWFAGIAAGVAYLHDHGIVLMSDSCILGPQRHSHICCPKWPEELVLFRRGEDLHFRTSASVELDGQLVDQTAPLPGNCRLETENFAVSFEDL